MVHKDTQSVTMKHNLKILTCSRSLWAVQWGYERIHSPQPLKYFSRERIQHWERKTARLKFQPQENRTRSQNHLHTEERYNHTGHCTRNDHHKTTGNLTPTGHQNGHALALESRISFNPHGNSSRQVQLLSSPFYRQTN